MRALRALGRALADNVAGTRRPCPTEDRPHEPVWVRVLLVAAALFMVASRVAADTPPSQPGQARIDAWRCAYWIPDPSQRDVIHHIEECRTAVEATIKDARTLSVFFTNLGVVEISLHLYNAAIGDLDGAIAANPQYMEALTDRAVAEDYLGKLAEAKTDREAVVLLRPRGAEEYLSLATALQHLDRQREAVDAYTSAIQKSPAIRSTRYSAFKGRGSAYLATGQFDLAIADFTTAVQIAPEIGDSWNARCSARAAAARELDAALSDCDHALEIAPQCSCRADWLTSRGFVYFRMGKFKEAAQDFDAAIAVRPRYWTALFLRGVVRNREGDSTGGAADISLARSIAPNVADLYAQFGVIP